MKQDKVIIYDNSCPLCTWYTGVFTRTGFLDKDGRQPFSNLDKNLFDLIDKERSRNEIPLVNMQTGKVHYGIDALLEIIGKRSPLLEKTGRSAPVYFCAKKLYKFVSYNRRVIVAAENSSNGFDCTPDFNFKYRAVFMLFCLLLNTALLFPLYRMVFAASVYVETDNVELQVAHFALVLSNVIIASFMQKKMAFEYLGQVTMLALVAMLLTIPLLILNVWWHSAVINNIYLAAILIFVLKEYFRRMRYAGILNKKLVMPLNFFFLILFLILWLKPCSINRKLAYAKENGGTRCIR